MKLILAGNPESVDPVLAVRWCLERSEVQQLKERNAEDIHILFVIAYEGTDLEDRQIVPIDQVMTYLNLRRPGKHTVFAKVVWRKFPPGRFNWKKWALRRATYYRFEETMLNYERTDFAAYAFGEDSFVHSLRNDAELEVVVPKEHFPAEPSEWLKRLVNWGFSYPAVDECQFRKRKYFVLAPKLLAFGLWAIVTTVIRTIVALCLGLSGMRKITFKAILHPWRYDIEDIGRYVHRDDSWFARNEYGYRRSRLIYLCHPIIYLALFAILTAFKLYYHTSYWSLIIIATATLTKITITALKFLAHILSKTWGMLLAGVTIYFLARLFVYVKKIATARKRERESTPEFTLQKKREQERSYDELYKLLACKPNLVPSLSTIPAERQTIRLKFLDLKAKACRPFPAR